MVEVLMASLRELRLRLGLTQKELAEQAGVSRMTVIRCERDEFTPDPVTVKKLRAALGPAGDTYDPYYGASIATDQWLSVLGALRHGLVDEEVAMESSGEGLKTLFGVRATEVLGPRLPVGAIVAIDGSRRELEDGKRFLLRFRGSPQHLTVRACVREGDAWRLLPSDTEKYAEGRFGPLWEVLGRVVGVFSPE